jgi:ABC-2 type transport system ATP-binding protein
LGQGLICDGLTKVYSGSAGKKALDDANIKVDSRGIFALIGMNGAGKTTLIRILATQLEPSAGRAEIDGVDVVKEAKKLRQRMAIVPQEARTVPWMTPKQTVASYLLWRGLPYGDAKKEADEALAEVGVAQYSDTLNRRLSGGIKRKVLVATVLAADAPITFLDEPTTGLDPISRRELWAFLERLAKDRFVVLTTHYLEEAEELANVICILHRGKIAGLGTLDYLRSTIKQQFSIMVQPGFAVPRVSDGVATKGRDGQTQVLTGESEAYSLSRELLASGVKFSMSKVSLNDVFFQVVHSERQEGAN